MLMKHLLLVLCLVLLATSQASARTWYVSKDGTGDATTIPQGMDMASYGDTVLVGPGTYTESTTRYGGWTSLVFMKGGVILMSEAGPENTVLDAAEASGSPLFGAAVHCPGAEGECFPQNIAVIGFTIINARFWGIHVCGADPYLGPVTIRDCRIVNSGADAGAVAVVCPNSLIEGNYINGPAAHEAIEIAGGATVMNNTIVGARRGIRITGPGSSVIHGNLIQDCTYALWATDVDPVMQSNTIVGCGTGLLGGGNFERNIVVDCGTGVDASLGSQNLALGGNDLYGNSRDYINCTAPVDDIHVDPMFCGREIGDYRLCDTSPCVDGPCGLIGAFGVGCTCGVATEPTT
jgi:hypothetical protein